MKTVTSTVDRRTCWVKSRPLNCAFETSLEKRCPNCGQNHITSGYCQALDPDNASKYPKFHQSHKTVLVETESHGDETVFETDQSQPWIAEGISRATYFRRKTRAANA
jgi:hypothetical protein